MSVSSIPARSGNKRFSSERRLGRAEPCRSYVTFSPRVVSSLSGFTQRLDNEYYSGRRLLFKSLRAWAIKGCAFIRRAKIVSLQCK